jgi:glycosyltransferase involved in cell wall biosynthesis
MRSSPASSGGTTAPSATSGHLGESSPPRSISLVLPSFAAHDAVGHDTAGIRDALRAPGRTVRIFAASAAPGLEAEPLAAAQRSLERGDLVIYQQSTGWAEGERLLAHASGPIVVRDHAVTPGHFFAASDAALQSEVAAGERQRAALARDPRVTRFLATSPVTARELVSLGAPPERVAVVPPFSRVEELAAAVPDAGALRRLTARPADVLFVGRVAPNKGQHRIQRVLSRYGALFREVPRLRLVGKSDHRHDAYASRLRRERIELRLEGAVETLGEVTEPVLKAAYLCSRVFLCCSLHEGFCVPLVEAAWLGVPVVAAHLETVEHTLGSGGLVLPPDADDDLLAVSLHRVLADAGFRERLVEEQRASVRARFSRAAIARELAAALAPFHGSA